MIVLCCTKYCMTALSILNDHLAPLDGSVGHAIKLTVKTKRCISFAFTDQVTFVFVNVSIVIKVYVLHT